MHPHFDPMMEQAKPMRNTQMKAYSPMILVIYLQTKRRNIFTRIHAYVCVLQTNVREGHHLEGECARGSDNLVPVGVHESGCFGGARLGCLINDGTNA